jgi:serine/threonine-protein kinase RsbW
MSNALFTMRTERFTAPQRTPRAPDGETRNQALRAARQEVVCLVKTLIRMQMLGLLEHRDVALRAVSAACKLVSRRPHRPGLNDFRMHVVSAVGEAFNNIVLHSYAGRDDGVIEMEIRTDPDLITVELRDYGESFDLDAVATPNLDLLPESGLGIFIIKAFMSIRYRPGRHNVLTLSKSLAGESADSPVRGNPSEGDS